MPTLPLYQIDAFTQRPFAGNPAAVCPVELFPPDTVLQAIASENNLSETAFVRPRPDGDFDLRWFTPAHEVDLCGHATLASGHVVLRRLRPQATATRFHTRSGVLTVARGEDGALVMDLPAGDPTPCAPPTGLSAALGIEAEATLAGRYLMAVLPDAEAVRAVKPDFGAVKRLDAYAVCVTAPGTGIDADVHFVSRLFAPKAGIDEDPVTGSAHCLLTPYWAERLGEKTLRARQVSRRTGELVCTWRDDRVELVGYAVEVIEGKLHW